MTVVNSVRETSGVGEARRAAARLAHCSGLADDVVGRIALVATELATNLLKHAGGGLVVIDRFADADGSGLEMLALDNGPACSMSRAVPLTVFPQPAAPVPGSARSYATRIAMQSIRSPARALRSWPASSSRQRRRQVAPNSARSSIPIPAKAYAKTGGRSKTAVRVPPCCLSTALAMGTRRPLPPRSRRERLPTTSTRNAFRWWR